MGRRDQDSHSMASAVSRHPSSSGGEQQGSGAGGGGRRTPRWYSLRRMFQDIQRQRHSMTSRSSTSSSKKRSSQTELESRTVPAALSSSSASGSSRWGSRHSAPAQYDRDGNLITTTYGARTTSGSGIEVVVPARDSMVSINMPSSSSVAMHPESSVVTRSSVGSSERIECRLCALEQPRGNFPYVSTCDHRACRDCLRLYLRIEITESRINIACPECNERMHPNDIAVILEDAALLGKYEEFMLRRVLVHDPDARWCPAPDCGYAVIASGCASCPQLTCERPGCGTLFCYNCKQHWHPNQTCDAAKAERLANLRSSSLSYSQDSNSHSEIKPCPRCGAFIVKMDDGSCNHMTCAVCGAEFCWLCMMEISDLHYLSPSGCTFWGKKPWSRKKKILWQLGTLIGAPVGITLIAGIAVPAIIIGVPIWVGRKLYAKCSNMPRHKRNLAVAGGVIGSILISPVLAAVAVGVGVPILLAYVYGVVPISLCRSGGCGVTTSNGGGVRIDFDENEGTTAGPAGAYAADARSVLETVDGHHVTPSIGPSIGEMSMGMTNSLSASGSHLERVGVIREDSCDRDSASQHAIGGSCVAPDSLSATGAAGQLSGAIGGNRLEVQAEMSANPVLQSKRASLSSESANMSLETKSGTISFGDNISTNALAGSILSRDRDNASAVVSFSDAPLELPIPVLYCSQLPPVPSLPSSSDNVASSSAMESVYYTASTTSSSMQKFNSPPATRSVSFGRDIKSGSELGGGHDGGSGAVNRVKSYKRQSMSVGDSIDERVETNFDYLSVHSLAEEPGLECCTGGSDIVAMVAAEENAANVKYGGGVVGNGVQYGRLVGTRSSVDGGLPGVGVSHRGVASGGVVGGSILGTASGLTDLCGPPQSSVGNRRYGGHPSAQRAYSAASSSDSTSVEIIESGCPSDTRFISPVSLCLSDVMLGEHVSGGSGDMGGSYSCYPDVMASHRSLLLSGTGSSSSSDTCGVAVNGSGVSSVSMPLFVPPSSSSASSDNCYRRDCSKI